VKVRVKTGEKNVKCKNVQVKKYECTYKVKSDTKVQKCKVKNEKMNVHVKSRVLKRTVKKLVMPSL